MTDPEFRSCFISYAHKNDDFAEKLYQDLQANGVTCWKDSYDMEGGKFWRTQISKAIKDYDKLLLVCSGISILRSAVVEEILAAMEREREQERQKLFPIRLDDAILGKDVLAVADEKMEAGEWREDWVHYVRAYHIPDFSNWQDESAYQRAFLKLLRDLKNPSTR